MIRMERGPGCLRIWGHALYGEKGKDVVCAGVSSLVWTLAENLRRAGGQGWLRPGQAELSWEEGPETEKIVDAFWLGFRQLARQYPQHLTLSREQGPEPWQK